LAALLIAALAVVAAGCGGSSNNEASSDTTTTVATDTTASTDTGTATDTTATDTGSAGSTGTTVPALSGKCKDLAQLGTKLSQSMAGQTGDLEDASKVIDELAGQVPDEIKPDFQVIAKNFKKIAVALKGVQLKSGQTPSPAALAKLQQIVSSMDSPEIRRATAHIEAWAAKNC
jgi:hypothetical protein